MKIAILGGSFDPPHFGHILVAEQVKKFLNLDQIWLMPCYKHPFNKKLSSPKHRFLMTKKLENTDIKISDFEIKKKTISFTFDTLNLLTKKKSQDEFYWIIGSEQLENFQKWQNWQKIIENFNLIIFPREIALKKLELEVRKYLKLRNIPKNIFILNSNKLKLSKVSSTKVRNAVKDNHSIKNFVPKEVEEYIVKNKLYKS